MGKLSHLDSKGRVKMVDVSEKPDTKRIARAGATVFMRKATLEAITKDRVPKGDVFATAKIAGIQAAKRTFELIPMCHPLNITNVDIEFKVDKKNNLIKIASSVSLVGKTGVEMEALTACAIAGLTIYDMCKSLDRDIVISDIKLLEKSGGKSGTYKRR